MADTFAERLTRSLDALHDARPAISARIGSALGERRVALTIDGESVAVEASGGRPQVTLGDAVVAVRVDTGRRTLRALVEGRQDVLAALRAGQLRVTGHWRDLVALDAALAAYLDGAVRVVAMQEQWTDFAAGSDDG